MDCSRLVPCIVALTLALALAAQQQSAAALPDIRTEDDGKVLVELYSESLCPFCANFIVNYLSKFFANGLIDIVELRIIPYGNAKIDSSGRFKCQHGPDECKLNIIQSCAIKLWPDVSDWFPFTFCLELLPRQHAAKDWKTCTTGLNLTQVEQCYDGPLGYKVEMENAWITSKLDPPHTYVPWVLVNGQPLYEDYENIVEYVCSAYTGTKTLPQVCSQDLPKLRIIEPSLHLVSTRSTS